MPFSSAPKQFISALTKRGYHAPTPVQAAVLTEPKGADLLVSAQTGSGKTVAFGLALGHTLLGDTDRMPRTNDPLALIVAPTRELALQVERELAWLYADTGARLQTCVGGMDPRREHMGLRAGAHIVVGTPGRLCDHLSRGALNLTNIRAVVLDEADEMLDMGFREDLETLLGATPADRQTLLFSATLPRPIIDMASRYQKDAKRVSVQTPAGGHADITYKVMRLLPRERDRSVVNILRYYDAGSAMVFCATRDGTARLAATLTERGFSVATLSGDFSQRERNLALQALRDGRAKICVATDVAARGLDLPDVGLVLHADLPQNQDVLVHRSGRTGRAGKRGVAVLLVPDAGRRYVERTLQSAKVKAEWTHVPSAAEIREQDEARLLAEIRELAAQATEEDLTVARELLAEGDAQRLVAALVSARRAARPAPEDVARGDAMRGDDSRAGRGGPRERGERTERFERNERFDSGRGERPRHHEAPENVVAFGLDVGRITGADPRWIVPELCRRGGLTKPDIGKITIGNRESVVEIAADKAEQFFASVGSVGGGRKMRVRRIDGDVANAVVAAPPSDRGEDRERAPRPLRERPRPAHRSMATDADMGSPLLPPRRAPASRERSEAPRGRTFGVRTLRDAPRPRAAAARISASAAATPSGEGARKANPFAKRPRPTATPAARGHDAPKRKAK